MRKPEYCSTFLPPDVHPAPELYRSGDAFVISRNSSSAVMAAHIAGFSLDESPAFRFQAEAEVDSAAPPESVGVVADWFTSDGKLIARDYLEREISGQKRRFYRILPRPADAIRAELRMFSRWLNQPVRFFHPAMEGCVIPPRTLRLITAKIDPPRPSSEAENRQLAEKLFDRLAAAGENPDLILLTENLNTRSTPGLPSRKAQPVPGPWSEFLATQAKRFGSYIVTTLVERKGDALYNTAIIFDRNGELVGKYRKVHLTLSEAEAGFLPGSEFPVFPLDCVRVGIATCWDNWFSESVRHLALNGAELVLFPLAGDGDETHWRHIWPARAMDNGVILAASISQGEAKEPTPAQIILPDGSIAAETQENPGYAAATLDLNRRYLTYWLSVGPFFGEGPSLYRLERRDSVY